MHKALGSKKKVYMAQVPSERKTQRPWRKLHFYAEPDERGRYLKRPAT
jgi:hypothetical protein